MTIYDEAQAAADAAAKAVVEEALAQREAATATEKARADQLTVALAAAKSDNEGLNSKVIGLESSLSTQYNKVALLEDTVESLEDEIERLKAQAPESSKTLFGACVYNPGAGTLAGAQTVIAKFGGVPSIRQFYGNTFTWEGVPAGVTVHRSYKPTGTVTDTQIDGLLKAADADGKKNGVVHVVTFWHESDNDGLTAALRAARITLQNRLYERKVALGLTNVLVSVVFTGGMFASYGTQANRDLWKTVKGDLLGLDADGVHTTQSQYPQATDYLTKYDDEVINVKKFIEANKANGWIGWTVPEFGTSRRNYFDPTGAKRAAWMAKWGNYFAEQGAYLVQWYDYNTSSNPGPDDIYNIAKTGTPEFDMWRAAVGSNA